MFDTDGNGVIDFNEFAGLWQYVCDWQDTFRSFDLDNSGTIDKGELKAGTYGWLSVSLVYILVSSYVVQFSITAHAHTSPQSPEILRAVQPLTIKRTTQVVFLYKRF
jgi:hypothetical protein